MSAEELNRWQRLKLWAKKNFIKIIPIVAAFVALLYIIRPILGFKVINEEISVYYSGPGLEIKDFTKECNCFYPLHAKARLTSNGNKGYIEYTFQLNGQDLGKPNTLIFKAKGDSNVHVTPPKTILELAPNSEYQITLNGTYHSDHFILKFLENFPLLSIDFSEKFQADPITLKCTKNIPGMVYINGGTIRVEEESCEKEISISNIYVDQNEVSYLEYDKLESVCGITEHDVRFPYQLSGMTDDEKASHPMVWVSWEMADCFCKQQGKRLPTSDEWEYIARGGIFYNSSDKLRFFSNCLETFRITQITNSKEENPLRIFDINCNAYEWTSDYFQDEYYKIVRGGGSHETAYKNLCHFEAQGLDLKHPKIGFRCVKEAE